ncbi:MAG: SDR family NAD(P)-dependent oxidoreductase [Dehalococcoidia bacterium]|nr:SDR family NAD(P)-dependent oxidoreductase [Dehalococcoidia bacterium]
MRLKDKVALVTGGASGIGLSICLTFAREGAQVAVVDMNLKGAEQVVSEIQKNGGKAIAVRCDVSNFDEVDAAVKQVLKKYKRIDILVNDAGSWSTKRFLDLTIDDWNRIVHVCYFGVLNFCKAVLPNMIDRKSGRIVNISSRTAQVGNVYNSVYAGAKGAIDSFSKSIAKDMGQYNITVNCVAPGLTETPGSANSKMLENIEETLKDYPLGRLGSSQDVANAALFLASDESSFISGTVVTVAGGGSCR